MNAAAKSSLNDLLGGSRPSLQQTGGTSQRLVDDLDSLKLEGGGGVSSSMTSSYSNKTNELINRTQNFLERANFNKNNAFASNNNPESITWVTPLTNGNEDFVSSNRSSSNQNSITNNNVNSREYNELLKELSRYKEENAAQKAQIEELKSNQQQFL